VGEGVVASISTRVPQNIDQEFYTQIVDILLMEIIVDLPNPLLIA